MSNKPVQTSAEHSHQVWLPAMFWHDHADRDLPAGELLKESGRRVLIRATCDELAEIRSDAAFYSDRWGPDELPPGLKQSAAATVRAIKKYSSGGNTK